MATQKPPRAQADAQKTSGTFRAALRPVRYSVCMQLTRRTLALAVLAPAAVAQTPPPVDEVQAARDRIKTNGQIIAKVELLISTEPAFQFKA